MVEESAYGWIIVNTDSVSPSNGEIAKWFNQRVSSCWQGDNWPDTRAIPFIRQVLFGGLSNLKSSNCFESGACAHWVSDSLNIQWISNDSVSQWVTVSDRSSDWLAARWGEQRLKHFLLHHHHFPIKGQIGGQTSTCTCICISRSTSSSDTNIRSKTSLLGKQATLFSSLTYHKHGKEGWVLDNFGLFVPWITAEFS